MKKTATSLALAGFLVLGGAAAATADQYPVEEPDVTVSDPTPTVGQPITITVEVPDGVTEVNFAIDDAPAGSTLTSMVFAELATVDLSVDKAVVDNSASAVFTPAGPGTFTVLVTGDGMEPISLTLVVTAAEPGDPDDDGGLAPTGGEIPAGVIWAGVGAIGLGGAVVAAAAIRRRSSSN